MSTADDFIERGYFPREFPPCFTTRLLALYVAAKGLQVINGGHAGSTWTRAARHNLARPAGLRRVLSVPNPINFLLLAEACEAAWAPLIGPLLATTTVSASRPAPSLGPRALAPAVSSTGIAYRKALARSGRRYLLRTDIQNFYPSIYTHSIPWALHGKATAKALIGSAALQGNVIDKAIRDGQEGQTMGLPIGPDTSWALAECLLARVEERLRAALPSLRGYRYNDDFELLFSSLSDTEAALASFQGILAEFELSVNPRKTRILELPQPLEDPGVSELRSWRFRQTAFGQRSDIVAYFDRLTELLVAAADSEPHLAAYAVARLREEVFLQTSWPLLESLFLQLLVAQPYCARQVAMAVSMLTTAGHTPNGAAISAACESLAVRHAPLGHGSEVAWALWLSLAFQVPVTQPATVALSNMEDCLVALLALDARSRGLIGPGLGTQAWEDAMTTAALRSEWWLLSYEAYLQGWLPSKGTANHIAPEPFFQDLLAARVSFYDQNGFVLAFQRNAFPPVGGGGGPYIL